MASNSLNTIICCGGIFLAKSTKRFLFLQRTHIKTAGTWGFVGGKKEPTDTTSLETLNREISEEIGECPSIKKIVPLELFTSTDQNFQYNTYVLITENEFIPVLNNEHCGYAWVNFDQWPKPLHNGVKNSLNSKTVKAKLEILLEVI